MNRKSRRKNGVFRAAPRNSVRPPTLVVAAVASVVSVASVAFAVPAAFAASASAVPVENGFRQASGTFTVASDDEFFCNAKRSGEDCRATGIFFGCDADDFDATENAFRFAVVPDDARGDGRSRRETHFFERFTCAFALSGTAKFVNDGVLTFVDDGVGSMYGFDGDGNARGDGVGRYRIFGNSVALLSGNAVLENNGKIGGVIGNAPAFFLSDAAAFTNRGIFDGNVSAARATTVTLAQGSLLGGSLFLGAETKFCAENAARTAKLGVALNGDGNGGGALVSGSIRLYAATALSVFFVEGTVPVERCTVRLCDGAIVFAKQKIRGGNGVVAETSGEFVATAGTFFFGGKRYAWVLDATAGTLDVFVADE